MIRIVTLGAILLASFGTPALAGTVKPHAPPPTGGDSLLQPATFVHMVGRFYTIEQWVTKDLGATLVEIIPINHEGNPAFRVIYLEKDATEPTTVIVMAGGHGMEVGEVEPIIE